MKGMLTIGILVMMAASGVMNASGSFALDASRTDVAERIGHGGSLYSSGQVINN